MKKENNSQKFITLKNNIQHLRDELSITPVWKRNDRLVIKDMIEHMENQLLELYV
jgi:hypothetical protein